MDREKIYKEAVKFRRYFHQHPEVSMKEFRTQAYIVEILKQYQIAYTTSKWAMRGTSYNLQVELKKHNCRVIQFNVGGMNTRMHTKWTGKVIEHPEEWMNPADIADLMVYLLKLPKMIEVSEITINRKVV